MKKNAEIMVLASFAGDSLALGVHWIYDVESLVNEYGRVEGFIKPAANSYHSTKENGDFTHYGDQMLVLLESVASKGKYDAADFLERWKVLFSNYSGYIDHATQATLQNIADGKGPESAGSFSNDLAGAVRISPLILCYRDNAEELIRSARMQTAMTHGDTLTIDSAEFFASVVFKILHGSRPSDAMQEVVGKRFSDSKIAFWVEQGMASIHLDSISAITRFGQSCATPEAFPGVVHLVAKHENSLKEALVQSVMAGGDNAARSMAIGMVLGAYAGAGEFPKDWITGIRKRAELKQLIEKIQ